MTEDDGDFHSADRAAFLLRLIYHLTVAERDPDLPVAERREAFLRAVHWIPGFLDASRPLRQLRAMLIELFDAAFGRGEIALAAWSAAARDLRRGPQGP